MEGKGSKRTNGMDLLFLYEKVHLKWKFEGRKPAPSQQISQPMPRCRVFEMESSIFGSLVSRVLREITQRNSVFTPYSVSSEMIPRLLQTCNITIVNHIVQHMTKCQVST